MGQVCHFKNYIAGSHRSKPPLWSKSQQPILSWTDEFQGVQLWHQDDAEGDDVKSGPNPARLTSVSAAFTRSGRRVGDVSRAADAFGQHRLRLKGGLRWRWL